MSGGQEQNKKWENVRVRKNTHLNICTSAHQLNEWIINMKQWTHNQSKNVHKQNKYYYSKLFLNKVMINVLIIP